jgi:hypothetical protein
MMSSRRSLSSVVAALLGATAALLIAAPAAGAQRMAGTLHPSDGSHSVHVFTDSARLTVSGGARSETAIEVQMPAGTFALRSDSATMATWADQAAELPPVPPTTVLGGAPTLPGILLRGVGSGAANAMRLVRMASTTPGDTNAPYMLEATNGAWIGSTVLSSSAFLALAQALHGRDVNGELPHADSTFLEFEVDRPAQQLRVGRTPKYPEAFSRAHVPGEVQMQFVVGPDGRARPETYRLLRTTAPEFARAVREVLPTYRYSPAMIDGKAVAMVVQQAFEFKTR